MAGVNVLEHIAKARAGVARVTSLLSLVSSVALLSTTALVSSACAASVNWTGAVDGNWFNGSNWTPGAVPGGGDSVIINVGGAPVVIAAGTASAASLKVGNSAAAALTIQAGGSLAVSGAAIIGGGVSANGSGVLTVQSGGSLATESAVIGEIAGSDGTVTVTGTGSIWQLGALRIGHFGNGSLTISDGGKVLQTGTVFIAADSPAAVGDAPPVGIVTVTGVGSTWNAGTQEFNVAYNGGTATLNVEAGGTVINGTFVVGGAASATGNVLVDGVGSRVWTQ